MNADIGSLAILVGFVGSMLGGGLVLVGVVRERDLGPETEARAAAIDAFDPGDGVGWRRAGVAR